MLDPLLHQAVLLRLLRPGPCKLRLNYGNLVLLDGNLLFYFRQIIADLLQLTV